MSGFPSIWVLSQGLAGTENQCLGIAERLGGNILIKRINIRFPWTVFSPYLRLFEGPRMLAAGSDSVAAPWPDVVIAGGRRAIGMARYIKRVSPRTVVCVVQDPKVNPAAFDLVAAPFHDGLNGPNVLVTDGAPNRITPQGLAAARDKWAPLLGVLPAPRVAVLVGGSSKTHQMTITEIEKLVERVRRLREQKNASVMVTVSRRTPPELAGQLADALRGENTVIYTGDGENPYHGFLAYADYIVCTTDSTSMISDAATTGHEIELFPLPGQSARHDRFLDHLRALGVGVPGGAYVPFDDAGRVAAALKTLLDKAHNKDTKNHG